MANAQYNVVFFGDSDVDDKINLQNIVKSKETTHIQKDDHFMFSFDEPMRPTGSSSQSELWTIGINVQFEKILEENNKGDISKSAHAGVLCVNLQNVINIENIEQNILKFRELNPTAPIYIVATHPGNKDRNFKNNVDILSNLSFTCKKHVTEVHKIYYGDSNATLFPKLREEAKKQAQKYVNAQGLLTKSIEELEEEIKKEQSENSRNKKLKMLYALQNTFLTDKTADEKLNALVTFESQFLKFSMITHLEKLQNQYVGKNQKVSNDIEPLLIKLKALPTEGKLDDEKVKLLKQHHDEYSDLLKKYKIQNTPSNKLLRPLISIAIFVVVAGVACGAVGAGVGALTGTFITPGAGSAAGAVIGATSGAAAGIMWSLSLLGLSGLHSLFKKPNIILEDKERELQKGVLESAKKTLEK